MNTTTKRNGEVFQTKNGVDGRTEVERHNTDHGKPWAHMNPHDHKIDWNNPDEHPVPGPPINYPGGAPEFKQYVRTFSMDNYIVVPDGSMNFKTIIEFKRSIKDGGEIVVEWDGYSYGIFFNGTQFYITSPDGSTAYFQTVDDLLEQHIGGDRLREIITLVTVIERTL